MKTEKAPTVEQLASLAPLLATSLKKEIDEVVDLLNKFKAQTVAELAKTLEPLRKEYFASPQALAARIRAYRESVANGETPEETVDELVKEFSAATSKTIKELSKKLGVYFVDKKSAPIFRRWLETGETPPTEEELLVGAIQGYVDSAQAILNESSSELTKDALERVIAVAEAVNKAHKLVGLKLFVAKLGFDIKKARKADIVKSLHLALTDLAMTRHKRTQILG